MTRDGRWRGTGRHIGRGRAVEAVVGEDEDGILTGRVRGPILWGPGKAQAVRDFALRTGIPKWSMGRSVA